MPSVAGGVVNREALHRANTEPVRDDTGAPDGALAYRLATTVADHWIPLDPFPDPTHRPQQPADPLLRAALLDRTGIPALSRPQGRIFEGRRPDLSLFEEDVSASGVRLIRHYPVRSLGRWQYVLWLARRKGPGRLDQSSGLGFDLLEEA